MASRLGAAAVVLEDVEDAGRVGVEGGQGLLHQVQRGRDPVEERGRRLASGLDPVVVFRTSALAWASDPPGAAPGVEPPQKQTGIPVEIGSE